MGTMQNIYRALSDRLLTAGFPTDDIAWPNAPYTPVQQRPFLSVQMSGYNRRPIGRGANATIEHRGTYQISVYHPAGTGMDEVAAAVDTLVDHFRRGETLTSGGSNVLIEVPSPTAPLIQSDWVHVPVVVQWMCYEYP